MWETDDCGYTRVYTQRTCAHSMGSALYWITLIQLALIGLGLFEISLPQLFTVASLHPACILCTIFNGKLNSNGLHDPYLADGAYPDAVYLDYRPTGGAASQRLMAHI